MKLTCEGLCEEVQILRKEIAWKFFCSWLGKSKIKGALLKRKDYVYSHTT
jgi:hypothetical protein